MPTSTVVVGSAVGLHARPAALIAAAVTETGEEVTISMPDGEPVDASSALLIMTLGAAKGDTVVVASPSQAAHDAIAALVAQDLDV